MNLAETDTATCETGYGPVDIVINSRETKSGSINLHRIVPADELASIGPFFSLVHFSPAHLPPGESTEIAAPSEPGMVGLTYLLDGDIILGDFSGSGEGFHSWISVPFITSEGFSAIDRYPSKTIPRIMLGDVTVVIVLGEVYGKASPVAQIRSTLFLICELPEKGEFALPVNYSNQGVYVVSGCIDIDGHSYAEGVMAVAAPGWPVRLRARRASCVLIIGYKRTVDVHQG